MIGDCHVLFRFIFIPFNNYFVTSKLYKFLEYDYNTELHNEIFLFISGQREMPLFCIGIMIVQNFTIRRSDRIACVCVLYLCALWVVFVVVIKQ